VLCVSVLDSSSLGLTLNLQLSTFNRVFLLRVLCRENSSSFRSSLIPRHSPLTTNSFIIRTSMTPLPQPLYNPHLQAPLGSAGNKGLITPLESALTRNSPVTSLESALTKNPGGGGIVSQTCDEACLSRATIGSQGTYFLFISDKEICPGEHRDDGTFRPCRKESLLKSRVGSHGLRWRAAKPGYPSVPLRWSVLGATIGHSQAQVLAVRETSPLLPVSKNRERTPGIARRCPRLAVYPDLVGAVPDRAGRPAHQHRVGKAGSVRLG